MKLQPNEMPNALLFALRMTEISRWGIVSTSRQQSVGEHTIRVIMIAQAMYDYMEDGQPHNSFERIALTSFAMGHDIFEVISGDLDSIFKIAVKAMYPDVYDNVVEKMATSRRDSGPLYQQIAGEERAGKGTMIEVIVKLADMIEALIYLDTYGTNTRHAQHIRDNILERMWAKLDEFESLRTFGMTADKWARIEQFINLVLNRPGMNVKVRQNREIPRGSIT